MMQLCFPKFSPNSSEVFVKIVIEGFARIVSDSENPHKGQSIIVSTGFLISYYTIAMDYANLEYPVSYA